jgi:hypothetical protein
MPVQLATTIGQCLTNDATTHATDAQPTSLKAASLLVLQRNRERNRAATENDSLWITQQKQRNFCPEKMDEKLRPVAPVADELHGKLHPEIEVNVAARMESLREDFEERSGILEYDANLPREQAEEAAYRLVFCAACCHSEIPDTHRAHLLMCAAGQRGGYLKWASEPAWCDRFTAKTEKPGVNA